MRTVRWLGPTLACVVALVAIAHAQQGERPQRRIEAAQPRIAPDADRYLRRMSDSLRRMGSFRVTTDFAIEAVLHSGQKLQFVGTSNVAVRRPNMLRADRHGEQTDMSLFYDGRTLTLLGRRANLYATAEAPPNLDEAIDFAREELDLEAPGADLLYSDPYRILTEDTVSASYIGPAVVDGVQCHHIASRGNTVDWQLWIEDSPRALPRRYVIVSKDVTGQPAFTVELRDWEPDANIPASQFAFAPPPGAQRIEFLRARETVREQARRVEQPRTGGR